MTPWPTGVPKPEAVEEYEEAEVISKPGWGGRYIDKDAADAALTECAAIIERQDWMVNALCADYDVPRAWVERRCAEQKEANHADA